MRRLWISIWLCLWASTALAAEKLPKAVEPPAAVSAADFVADPGLSHVVLSPNGQYLAQVIGEKNPGLTVTDLKTRVTKRILALDRDGKPIPGLNVEWVLWKNDDRLIIAVTVFEISHMGGRLDGDITGFKFGSFMVAIDRTGANQTQILKGEPWDRDRGYRIELINSLPNDPGHILIQSPGASGGARVWKVDVKTGLGEVVASGDGTIVGWGTDGDGNVVIRNRAAPDGVIIEARSQGEEKWTRVARIPEKELEQTRDFEFFGPTEKPGEFYVTVRPKTPADGEYRSLRTFDVRTRQVSAPIWPELKQDVKGLIYDASGRRLVGACYVDDLYKCEFKAPDLSGLYRGISKFFDNDRNILPISTSDDARKWLFFVTGPEDRGSYYLFDRDAKDIRNIGDKFPRTPPDKLGRMTRLTYAARDGVAISGYITRPPQGQGFPAITGKLPLIVMPHGGPEIKDSYDYDTLGQYLATRGYMVFQPNFRGSGGLGKAWKEAGDKQWGRRMADDVTDGVKDLIAKGLVDPNRICIVGISYGGYAALQAGAQHPELYKCVVSWAGVSDLTAQLRWERARVGEDGITYQYWRDFIGDPKVEPAQIIADSPVTYAEAYRPPVLLVHGDWDDTVPIEQSKIMDRALTRAGKKVRLITYKFEDHPEFRDHENSISALTEIASFVRTYIQPYADLSGLSAAKP